MLKKSVKIGRYLMIGVLTTLSLTMIFSSYFTTNSAFDACFACDNNYSSCIGSANSLPPSQQAAAVHQCQNTYSSCVRGNCFGAPPPGGGSSGGRGRTACHTACQADAMDCIDNGDTTCGAQYRSCLNGCN
jgi:hypothetical protein